MGKAEEYKSYLTSEKWRTLRRRAIAEAGGRCRVCNDIKHLHVHHRQYPEVLGEEPLSFLTVLCKTCHSLFHQKTTLKNKRGDKKSSEARKIDKKEKNRLKLARVKSKIWMSGQCRFYSPEEIAEYEANLAKG